MPTLSRSVLLRLYVCLSCAKSLKLRSRKFATAASPDIYDVVCVGGGPAGLSLLTALRTILFPQHILNWLTQLKALPRPLPTSDLPSSSPKILTKVENGTYLQINTQIAPAPLRTHLTNSCPGLEHIRMLMLLVFSHTTICECGTDYLPAGGSPLIAGLQILPWLI